MKRQVKKNNYVSYIAIAFVAILAVAGVVGAYSGVASTVIENVENLTINGGSGALGAAPSDIASGFYDAYVENDLTVDGDFISNGTFSVNGSFNYLEDFTLSTATTTLTAAMSGETFYISGGQQTYTLPATTTSDGVTFRFVINGSLTATSTIVVSDGGDDIEGTLLVAGAVVDCDAEDTITLGASFENLGDYVELRSDGLKWFIGDSGALTGSAITCSAS